MSDWTTVIPEAAAPTAAMPAAAAEDDWEPASDVMSREELEGLDLETGASMTARLTSSLAEKPEDMLATIRQFYPDAELLSVEGEKNEGLLSPQAAPEDAMQSRLQFHTMPGRTMPERQPDELMIAFTHPDTGKRTVVDPPGFFNGFWPQDWDWGDLVEGAVPAARMGAYMAPMIPLTAAGRPGVGHLAGVVASQAVNYAAEPIVEAITGVDVPDTRTLLEKAVTGGVDVGLEGALPMMGGGLTRVGQQGLRQGVNLRRGAKFRPKDMGQPQVIRGLEEMAIEEGTDPRRAIRGALPLATHSPTVQGFFQAAAKFPKSADVIKRRLDDTLGVIRRSFARTHKKAGGLKERYSAGEQIKGEAGIGGYIAARDARQEAMENQVERIIGGETMIPASNTLAMINRRIQRAETGGAKETLQDLVPGLFTRLKKDIETNGGELSFGMLRDYRTRIGPQASRGLMVGPDDARLGEFKELYGTIAEDLGNAAKQKGGKAANAWQKGQKHYAESETLLESVKDVANSKSFEDAFRAMFAGAEKGPSKLIAMKKVLTPEAFEGALSVKVWEMGTTAASTGARGEVTKLFHPTQFIREWRKLSDISKEVLFPKRARIRKELDRLARVTASEEQAMTMMNFSGTAQAEVYMDMLGDGMVSQFVGADISAAQVRVGLFNKALNPWNKARRAQRQAKLMTDPDFVRWMADGHRIKPSNPKGVANHLGKLSGVAAGKPEDVRRHIEDYLMEWKAALDEAQEQPPEPPGPMETPMAMP